MEDMQIVELYWQRQETALAESEKKYGTYCYRIADNILDDHQDSEECVNDTWLRAWNSMPPQRPGKLRMFFAKITRHLAFDRFKARKAQKRGGGEIWLALDELEECIPSKFDVEAQVMAKELEQIVNRFVKALPPREADIFVRRYFYTETITQVADRYGLTANHIAVILSRIRRKLKTYLEGEGSWL